MAIHLIGDYLLRLLEARKTIENYLKGELA